MWLNMAFYGDYKGVQYEVYYSPTVCTVVDHT